MSFNGLYRFEEFELDPARRSLTRNGTVVPISSKTFQVLTYLVSNAGRVVTKDELLSAVWPESFVEESNLPGYISGLRKALTGCPGCIVTVPGKGYQFAVRVHREQPEEFIAGPRPAGAIVLPPAEQAQAQVLRETTHVLIRETSVEARTFSRWTAAWIAVAMAAVAVAALAGWRLRQRPVPEPPPPQIVVADFVNDTRDTAFDGTLKSALEIVLAQSPYMDVMSERDGVKTIQRMGLKKDTPMTPDVAREVCERTNREVLITGTLSSLGERYVLTLEATDCVSGKHLVGVREDTTGKEGVLDALDRAGEAVRKGLHETGAMLTKYQVPLHSETTASLEALKAYSLGMHWNAQGKLKTDSMTLFRHAIELDPNFAMAYAELGVANLYVGQMETASACFKKAYELSGHVSENEQLRIRAFYFALGQRNLIEGIKAYQLWESTYPEDPSPWIDEVDAYMTLGQWNAALLAGEKARRRFPEYPVLHENLATIYRSVNRFDDSRRSSLTGSQVGKDAPSLHINLFEIAFAQQDKEALAREGQWFDVHEDGATVWYYPSFRGEAAASLGNMQRAEALFRGAHNAADRANLPEAADRILLAQASTELRLGLPDAARATVARLSKSGDSSAEAAIVRAELGDTAPADRFLAAHSTPSPGPNTDTLLTCVTLPRLRATLAMQRERPYDAIATLESARPYEMVDYTVLTLRAGAYLKTGQPGRAAAEYTRILDNPGIDPTSVLYPLAHLGLARALAAQNNLPGSLAAYRTFFTLWKDADPGLPVLQQAHREYAALRPNAN